MSGSGPTGAPETRAPATASRSASSSSSSDDEGAADTRGEPLVQSSEEPNPAELFVQPRCVGALYGVPIWIHPTLPVSTACFALYAYWEAGLLALAHTLLLHGPLLWSAVLLHELSHVWAARALGVRANEAILWPLGGLTAAGRSHAPGKDAVIALAGPTSHAPQAALFAAIMYCAHGSFGRELVLGEHGFFLVLCRDALRLHVLLLLANLLPTFPFDGARVLADVLVAGGRLGADTAAAVVVVVSAAALLAVGGYAVLLLAYGAPGGMVVGIVAVWMAISTKDLHDMRVQGLAHCHPLFERLSASDAPREPAAAGADGAREAGTDAHGLDGAPAGSPPALRQSPRSHSQNARRPRGAVQLADGPDAEP